MGSSIFICLYGAVIGWLAVYLPMLYLRFSRKKQQFFQQILSDLIEKSDFQKTITHKLESHLNDLDLEELIDRKLDDLVLVIKGQIPMASTFLTGGLLAKLKGSAREEIMKMIPDIKAKMIGRLERDFKPERFFEGRMAGLNFDPLNRYCLLYASIGALIGFILGMVQLAILSQLY